MRSNQTRARLPRRILSNGLPRLCSRRPALRPWFCPKLLAIYFLAATFVQPSENSRGISTDSSSGSDSNCPPSELHPIYGVGSWIWEAETRNKQTCRLWKSFQVPRGSPVADARLRITADNGYRVFLDGQEVGRGSDYHALSDYDLRGLVT